MTITFLCTENDCFTSDRYAYSMSSFSLTPSYFPHAMIISKPHRWFTQHSITFVPSGGLFKCIFQRFPYGLITQLDLIRACCVRTIRHKSYILSIIRHWIFVDFSSDFAIYRDRVVGFELDSTRRSTFSLLFLVRVSRTDSRNDKSPPMDLSRLRP